MAETKPKKAKTYYFKLNTKKSAFWSTEDESIKLSLPEASEVGLGTLYGKIDDNQIMNFRACEHALGFGILLQVTEKEYKTNSKLKEKPHVMTMNKIMEKDIIMTRKITSVLANKDEDVIYKYIREQFDPSVITNMTIIEERDKNRENILRALDSQFRKASGDAGMTMLSEETTQQYEFEPEDVKIEQKEKKEVVKPLVEGKVISKETLPKQKTEPVKQINDKPNKDK